MTVRVHRTVDAVPSILRRRWRAIALALAAVVLAAVALVLIAGGRQPVPLTVRDVGIDVVDGPSDSGGPSGSGGGHSGTEHVRIDGTLYVPPRVPAPAVLVAHGFGGSKDSVADQARELAERGFVVLAYSARGFGFSTGQIALNSPDYEVADARQLLDWLATRPEVVKDGETGLLVPPEDPAALARKARGD